MVTYPTFVKDPDAVLEYGFDWDDDDDPWLESGDTIATSSWSVPSGLTAEATDFGDTTTKVTLSGGTAGESYNVRNRITTNNGWTEDRTFTLIVRER